MEHQDAQDLFSAYLEGDLSPVRQQELVEHLDQCNSCRGELEIFRQTLRSLSGLKVLPPPAQFARQVQQRIYRRSRGRFFRQESLLMRIPFEWVSFIIILFMLAMYLILVLGQPTRVSPAEKSGSGSTLKGTGKGRVR